MIQRSADGWRASIDLWRLHFYACVLGWPEGFTPLRQLRLCRPCGPTRRWGFQAGWGHHHLHASIEVRR